MDDFYAYEGGVTTDPSVGKLEITQEEYERGIEALLMGQKVSIADGSFKTFYPVFKSYVSADGTLMKAETIPEGFEEYDEQKWYLYNNKYLKKDALYDIKCEMDACADEYDKLISQSALSLPTDKAGDHEERMSKIEAKMKELYIKYQKMISKGDPVES